MGLPSHLELEMGVNPEWSIMLELGLGLGLKPADIDKPQLRKRLWVNMKNAVGLNHLTAEICGIRSVIMLR